MGSRELKDYYADLMGFTAAAREKMSLNDVLSAFLLNPPAGGGGTTYTPGNGISVAGDIISVVPASGAGIVVDGSGISVDPTKYVRAYSGVVPNGSTTATVTHNLNTTKVAPTLTVASTGEVVDALFTVLNNNQITIQFATAPTVGQYNVLVAAIA